MNTWVTSDMRREFLSLDTFTWLSQATQQISETRRDNKFSLKRVPLQLIGWSQLPLMKSKQQQQQQSVT